MCNEYTATFQTHKSLHKAPRSPGSVQMIAFSGRTDSNLSKALRASSVYFLVPAERLEALALHSGALETFEPTIPMDYSPWITGLHTLG